MAQKQILIPEVMEDRELSVSRFNPNKLTNPINQIPRNELNINLTRNIDRSTHNDYKDSYNTTTNNTTNNLKGGFFRFLFDIFCLPFKILYKLGMFLEEKFDIKAVLQEDRENNKKIAWRRKFMKSCDRNYDFTEIL